MGVLSNAIRMGASQPAADDDDAYQIEKSLRFNDPDTPYLKRINTKEGNRRTWTYSFWIKQGHYSDDAHVLGAHIDTNNRDNVYFGGDNWFGINMKNGGSWHFDKYTAQLFRDVSAWMHIVIRFDSTQAKDVERCRIYVNGAEVTSWGGSPTHGTQNAESIINAACNHWIGAGPENDGSLQSTYYNGYLADVHFIDGLSLAPGAFGSFDSTGVWNPKAFAIPTPNKGATHSSTLVATNNGSSASFNSGNPATHAFDGIYVPGTNSNWANVLATGAGQLVKLTYTPATAISNPSSVRIFTYTGDSGDRVYIRFNGKARSKSIEELGYTLQVSAWVDASELLPKGEDITEIAVERTAAGSGSGSPIGGIEVDGVVLIDAKTDVATSVNDGSVWSDGSMSGTGNTTHTVEKCFSPSNQEGWMTGALAGETGTITQTLTLPTAVSVQSEMVIWMYAQSNSGNNADSEVTLGGHTLTDADFTMDATFRPVTVKGSRTITTIENKRVAVTGSYNGWIIGAIYVDGQQLVDAVRNVHGRNGFHLKLNDTALTRYLGKDTINGKLADATGGLPVYNTTDDDGDVKGSGYRADSSAGTTNDTGLVLAIPGDVLTDVHHNINTGSSQKTVTNDTGDSAGSIAVTTDESRLYGSSMYFNGTANANLTLPNDADFGFGTGDFCVELWVRHWTLGGLEVYYTDTSGNSAGIFLAKDTDNKVYTYYSSQILKGATALKAHVWYHVAYVRNSGTSKLYLNGVEDATASDTADLTTTEYSIGNCYNSNIGPFKGWMNDFRVYKGVAKYTGNFKPPTRNDWVPTNLSTTAGVANDSLTDSPTSYGTDAGAGGEVRGNYCTWNPLATAGPTFKNGNLDVASATSSAVPSNGTFGMSSGKWYWEVNYTGGNDGIAVGITKNERLVDFPGNNDDSWAFMSYSGKKGHNATQVAYGSSFTPTAGSGHGTVVGIALDVDARKIWWRIDGTWQASGNPATGANAAYTDLDQNVTYFPTCGPDSGGGNNAEYSINAGQRAFAHAAPSGFKCLCTANLSDTFSGDNLNNPSKFFDVHAYTGNGATITRSPFQFQPDFVWFKTRSHSGGHEVYDVIRTATKGLYPHITNAEATEADGLTAFTANGFTTGDGGWVNTDAKTYVAWAWDAGASVTPSSSYNITPSAQYVNADAGFSITAYTGNASTDQTIPHGLATAPDLIITKSRSHAIDWPYYHSSGTANKGFFLNLTNVENTVVGGADNVTHGGHQGVNNNTWTTAVGLTNDDNVNKSGETYISYAWTSIPGYSKFGGYTGTGADRCTIYTGFRPKFIAIKARDVGESTMLFDAKRDPYNEVDERFLASHDLVANQDQDLGDFLSNGFSIYNNWPALNQSGKLYTYWAWAEHPFKTARAR